MTVAFIIWPFNSPDLNINFSFEISMLINQLRSKYKVGFVSNREEERALSRDEFQRQVARALAKAIREFYGRYPPGQVEPLPGSGQ